MPLYSGFLWTSGDRVLFTDDKNPRIALSVRGKKIGDVALGKQRCKLYGRIEIEESTELNASAYDNRLVYFVIDSKKLND
jgi:hypothetical protein